MIAGVDEAGRGPLAGPVVAAAVIWDAPIAGVKDSKLLSPAQREQFYGKIVDSAVCYAIGIASVEEIEKYNILQATLLAMNRAVEGLTVKPKEVWVDGRDKPKVSYPVQTFIDGDALIDLIGAASILAKVTRDRLLVEYDKQYPGYGFAAHKGYSTRQHLEALHRLGPTPIHRRQFKPVAELIAKMTDPIGIKE
jgi:ribonuclease HII